MKKEETLLMLVDDIFQEPAKLFSFDHTADSINCYGLGARAVQNEVAKFNITFRCRKSRW